MVVASTTIDGLINAGSDGFGFREVHAGPGNGRKFARGNGILVDRQILVAEECQLVIQDGSIGRARQIPVSVIGQIEHGRLLVCRCFVVDCQFIVVVQGVGNHRLEGSGIPFLAIRAGIGEFHTRCFIILERFSLPEFFHEVIDPTVQMMGAVVGCDLVFLTVDRELSMSDPVGEATADATKIGSIDEVGCGGVEIQCHVSQLPITIGNFDRCEDAASIDQAHFHPVSVSQVERDDFAAIFGLTEGFSLNGEHGFFRGIGFGCRDGIARLRGRRRRLGDFAFTANYGQTAAEQQPCRQPLIRKSCHLA